MGMMEGILGLDYHFFLLSFVLTYYPFLLVIALLKSLQLRVWDIILDFSLFRTVCSQSSSLIKTEGIFFLFVIQG